VKGIFRARARKVAGSFAGSFAFDILAQSSNAKHKTTAAAAATDDSSGARRCGRRAHSALSRQPRTFESEL